MAGGGFEVTRVLPVLPAHRRWLDRVPGHAVGGLLASDLFVAGQRRR
jgi:hypothetical protein